MTPGQQLAALFDRELDCMRQLREALQKEYQALVDADVDALELATAEKNQVLGLQTAAMRQRQACLEQCGSGAIGADLEAFLSTCDNPGQLHARQQELQDMARQCHEANRNNGRMIARKQQHTLGALSILRQTDAASPTYSGEGGAIDGRSSRLLGKA